MFWGSVFSKKEEFPYAEKIINAENLMKEENLEEALEALNEIEKEFGKTDRVYKNRALIYLYEKNFEKAIAQAERLSDKTSKEYFSLKAYIITDKTLNQYKTGWYVPYEEREETLEFILELYQFNEKESKDFMEFWMDKLEANKNYMMYPQETECVDCQMPVNISPAPDSIRRSWFGFEEVSDAKENISEPDVDEIKREGFTVVEWGGFLLNNAIVE